MMLWPGAVTEGNIRQPKGDRRKVPEERDIHLADVESTADPAVDFRLCLLQKVVLISIDIDGQGRP